MSNNIKDVAERAGVSISTVSNVITGKRGVSPELTHRVNSAISELNYKVNPIASSLKSNHSRMLGVIITSFKSVFIGQLLCGIQETCIKGGYSVCVYESDGNLDQERRCLDILINSMADGIIILSKADSDCPEDAEYINHLKSLRHNEKKIPIVSLEKEFSGYNIDCIIANNRNAGYTAVRHLIELGHKKIGLITGPMDMEMCRSRMQGYEDALSEAGITPNSNWIQTGDFSPIRGYTCMRNLLNETDVTAVFAMNDQTGIGAIKAIKDSGLLVPNDIAVMGFDNIFPGTLISPSLSTINIPKFQIGVLAAQRLIDILEDKSFDHQTTVVNHQLIIRKSTVIDSDDSWDLFGW